MPWFQFDFVYKKFKISGKSNMIYIYIYVQSISYKYVSGSQCESLFYYHGKIILQDCKHREKKILTK